MKKVKTEFQLHPLEDNFIHSNYYETLPAVKKTECNFHGASILLQSIVPIHVNSQLPTVSKLSYL